ncbi:hypothetical protein [Peribacillus asahii]|uniref:hypothetical protein n=1 Tax=Peribacillus asahii TaxID=228899 RepID=UPI0037FE5E45
MPRLKAISRVEMQEKVLHEADEGHFVCGNAGKVLHAPVEGQFVHLNGEAVPKFILHEPSFLIDR